MWDNVISIKVSTVGMFIAQLPLHKMKYWLVKLKAENFNFDDEYPLVFIFLLRFLEPDMEETPDELLQVVDFLMETKNQVCTTELPFMYDILQASQAMFQIPDCLWISAVFGNIDFLKKFLPYWNQHPLAVLLFLRPWFETRRRLHLIMLKAIEKILPILIKIGGSIPNGTKLDILMSDWISRVNNIVHGTRTIPPNFKMLYTNISQIYSTIQKPASLKVMCRTIIRANAIGHGNNLPNYLESIVPPGLKDFITLNS